jgi:carotenoid 1,2-hydratase
MDEQSAIGAREGSQPDFSYSVPPLGYTWWYIDGLSDDGRYGITVIAFIGSVFSPYYLNARQHLGKDADPRDFSAFNVALYGCGRGKWAMTERNRHAVEQTPQRLQIGPSSLDWQGETLVGHFDEVTKPVPGKVRGSFRITPLISNSCTFNLDHSGIHRWRPLAPKAHIKVELDQPSLSWQGHAYFDTNAGNEPLEEGFSSWQWLRAESDAGATVVYDLTPRHGEAHTIAYQLRASCPPCPLTLPASIELPKTLWRMPRQALGDTPQAAKVVKTLEDTPFYSRSVVETKLEDERLTAIHESLSMDRFLHPATQWMLPWRMPRCAS